MTMSSSTVFLVTPVLRLSGAIRGVVPPKELNARTCPVTQARSSMR